MTIDRFANWIKLAVVGKPHGLRGGFYLSDRDDFLPEDGATFLIGKSPQDATVAKTEVVNQTKMGNGRVVVQFSDITTREQAEKIVHQVIWCERKAVGDDLVWADLIGRKVFAGSEAMGEIIDVYNFGASDVLVVKRSGDGKRLDIPFTDQYVDRESLGNNTSSILLRQDKNFFDEFCQS